MDEPPGRRLHLLVCAPAFPPAATARGGVQLAVRAQVERLARRYRVTVVAPLRLYPPLPRYREKMEEVPADPVAQDESESIRILRPRYVHLPVAWPLTDPLGVERAIRSAIQRAGRPDLVHGHWLHPQGLAAARAGRAAGIPVVITAHGRDVARFDGGGGSRYFRWSLGAALARADAVIGVSDAMVEKLRALGADPARLHVIRNGVDLDRFAPRDRAAARAELRPRFVGSAILGPERRLIVFAGELEAVKQVDRLLHALALLAPQGKETSLAIVGDGPDRLALGDLVSAHHLSDRVLFAGQRPHAEVATWLAAADVFVLPSATEGLPLVVPEALAAGTPVVASRVGGIPECVTEGETGMLVDPTGVASLAEALAAALSRPWDRARIRATAERFGWEAQVAKIEAVYAQVTAPQVRGAREESRDG